MSELLPTARLGAFAAECTERDFSIEVLDNAAFCMLDAFGLGLLARREPTVEAMQSLALSVTPQEGAARMWSNGVTTSLNSALEVNATAVHGHFHDDSDYSSWSHPGSLIVPPALCLTESIGGSLDLALRGIIAGYAAVDWLGAKEKVARALIARGIRTSPTLGTIGAAATGAAILGLGAQRGAYAIGISSSITGGLLEPVRIGADEWRVQNAHAARGGIMAAQLAEQGVVGAISGLEGPKGFLAAYTGMSEVPEEWAMEPAPDAVIRAVAKPYATLGDNMAAAIAAKLVHDDGVDISSIKSIRVTLWQPYSEYPGTDFRGPFERTAQAMASTVFAVGAMLVLGKLDYAVNRDLRQNEDILRLAGLATIEADHIGGPEDSLVEVTMFDGSIVSRHASEAPKTLLYHDRESAVSLFTKRAESVGHNQTAAEGLASSVFEHIDGKRKKSVSELLDGLLS